MALPLVTPADLLAFAPELATTPVLSDQATFDILAYVNELSFVNSAPLMTSSGVSPQVIRMARIYLACHLGLVTQRAQASVDGPLTGESVGGVRRSFGMWPVLASAGSLGETQYGRAYLALLGMSAGAHGPLVV